MAEKPGMRKEEEPKKKKKKKREPAVYNVEPAEEPVHGPEGREPYRV